MDGKYWVGLGRVLTSINGDCVTAPDVFRIDISEANVLDDDVLCVTNDADTFAFDHTLRALANQALVGADSHAQNTGLVVCDLTDLGRIGLVVYTPIVLVNSKLACRSSTPRSASSIGCSALSASEVKSLGEDNDAGRGILKVTDKLSISGWVDWRSAATTGYT
jgi:hypothetical protein